MAVTTKEIAERVGLSQPTVSRILTGATNYRIAPQTRERVLEVARQMGYRPNSLAHSLKRKRTGILGFYTGYGFFDARNDFLAEIIGHLQMGCDAEGLDLLLHGVRRGQASVDEIYERLIDQRIDGLFLHTAPEDPLAARLADSSLPVVALADALPGIPSVTADDVGGMHLLVEYLWQRGYRRIAFLKPRIRLTSVERRCHGFIEALTQQGVPTTEAESCITTIRYEHAEEVLTDLWERPAQERPEAICCWNDRTAYNLLQECDARGLRVPEDIAVAGFDGFLATKSPTHHLVTVKVPWGCVAGTAIQLLLARLNAAGGAAEEPNSGEIELPAETCIPTHLAQGDTA